MKTFLLLLSPLLFIMCSNEVTDKDEYEAHIKVTANPPLDAGMGLNNLSNSLVVLGVDQDGRQINITYQGLSAASEFTTETSGTYLISDGNFTMSAVLTNAYSYECSEITVELFIDGNSYDKQSAMLGTDNMGTPCGNEISLSYNLILP